jgi:predicted DNA-binding transcriptional regulator YafY
MERLDRTDRLDLVLRLLRERPGVTAADLAKRLGTSTRSVFRDVARLRRRGYPVEASRGRGGGLRLHPSYGLGRIMFSPEEAVGMLLSLAIADVLALPMFAGDLGRSRLKIVGAFPDAERQRLRKLRERILVGPAASAEVQAGYGRPEPKASRGLQAAFVAERVVELEYRRQDGQRSRRQVEPHAILLNWPAWYVIGYDHLRNDVRTFRLDRVMSATAGAESFRPRPRVIIRSIGDIEHVDPDRWSL